MSYSACERGALVWVRPGTPFQELRRVVDKEGRYALLDGLLDGQSILLGSIYAPNVEQDRFYDSLTGVLAQFTSIPWVLGGDYNCALNIALDRSHPPPPHSPARKQTERFQRWVAHWALVDTWRAHHPLSRIYSFHSIPHNLRVRLDRFLCSPSLIPKVQHTDYLGRVTLTMMLIYCSFTGDPHIPRCPPGAYHVTV